MLRYPLGTRRHKRCSLSRLLSPSSLGCPRELHEESQSLEGSQCSAAGQRPRAVVSREETGDWVAHGKGSLLVGDVRKGSHYSNSVVSDLLWLLWCYCFSRKSHMNLNIIWCEKCERGGIPNQRMKATHEEIYHANNWIRKLSLDLRSLEARVTSEMRIQALYPSVQA